MVWSKATGHTFTTTQALGDFLMRDLLVRNGWTLHWSTDVSGDEYFAVSRNITTNSGAVLPFQLVFEWEYSSRDLNVYTLDTTTGTDYTAWQATSFSTLVSDTTYAPLSGGNVTVWEDDSSDSFVAYQNGVAFALQLDSTGWLVDAVNPFSFPGTRPKYGLLPIGEYGIANMSLVNGSTSATYIIANAINLRDPSAPSTDTGLYQDYAALTCVTDTSFRPIVHWEDPSGLMKMKAHQYVTDWRDTGYEVVQIDAEYYITAGPLLLPVGQTEPTL